ncbi:Gfo/Idh/MocA family oxidoreductase [Exiguobacterium alkaliphilum]|uniref:Gfo/Idh/MocA family oxidoreductase n=1 Tax=Exiguobacterium alkaliphilum TaxID=1428684 RepID=UPI0034646C90
MNIGIIGTGGIATTAHIPQYIAAGANVVAVMNRTRARGEAAARQFGIERVYETVEEMLQNESLDAVSVCTPNALHKDQVLAASRVGVCSRIKSSKAVGRSSTMASICLI